jgi:hypothetical protein
MATATKGEDATKIAIGAGAGAASLSTHCAQLNIALSTIRVH